jgi:uncharacterized membrane protein
MEKLIELATKELMIIFIAAMPLTELRGAIPIGIAMGMHPLYATILSILGSLIPVPFLLLFIKPVLMYFRQIGILKGLIDKAVKRTIKRSSKIKKYSAIGLFLFVAVPLPTTGVWTGCLAAILFNIPFRQAFPAIALGSTLAGIIMLCLSYLVTAI